MPCPNCGEPIDSPHKTTTEISDKYSTYERFCHIGSERGENVLAVHGGVEPTRGTEDAEDESQGLLRRVIPSVFLNG